MMNLNVIEQTLDSREVAEMIGKVHGKLIRDIRRYEDNLNEANIGSVDFFRESTYKDAKNETRPCYRITKKGCEFIAHKLTGMKGTIFTAKYINRFHEMQDMISNQKIDTELPWFIKKFRGNYIMLWRDFSTITGIDIYNHKPHLWSKLMISGVDFNGYGWKDDIDKFKYEFGFDFGDEPCMMYFYPCGITKMLKMLAEDRKTCLSPEAYETLSRGIDMIQKTRKNELKVLKTSPEMILEKVTKDLPIQINIVCGKDTTILYK